MASGSEQYAYVNSWRSGSKTEARKRRNKRDTTRQVNARNFDGKRIRDIQVPF